MKRSRKKHSSSSENSQTMAALAAGMADDFNNILTIILGACSLINVNATASSELLRSVSLIRVSAEHAAVLADRLASISGIHSGRMNLQVAGQKHDLDIKPIISICDKEKLLA